MDSLQRVRARLRARHPWVADALLAACLAVVHGWVVWVTPAPPDGPPGWLALAVTALGTLPVAARKVRPGLVLVVVGASMVAAVALAVPSPGFGLIVALFTYAAWTTRDDAVRTLAVVGGCTLLALLLADSLRFAPVNLLVFAGAWAAGHDQRLRRLRTAELERRAAHLERERDVVRRLASARERARIAREVHDVVAHGVAAMVAQAAAAERLVERDPAHAAEALGRTEETGRASLVELRRLLGLLRADGDADRHGAEDGEDDRHPLRTEVAS